MSQVSFLNNCFTEDHILLPIVHFEVDKKDICVLFIHGMCGSIVDNYFATIWGDFLQKEGIGFLYVHNRGHSICNDLGKEDGTFLRGGTMYDTFEDAIFDIDASIHTAYSLGYKRIILLGHSLGCNKVIYYYYKKKPSLIGIVLASAPDMVGIHKLQEREYVSLLKEAKDNIEKGLGMKLLSKEVEDYMYMSSHAYYNWYHDESNLDNLPILQKKENFFQLATIDVPILTFSGSLEEDYYHQLDYLKEKAKACKDFTYFLIEDTGHIYKDKEQEIAILLREWIRERF